MKRAVMAAATSLATEPSVVIAAATSEVERGAPSGTPARPGTTRAARLASWYRESPWAPAALKAAGLLSGMLALAGIGAASMLGDVRGVAVQMASASSVPLGHDLGAAWLALSHAEQARTPTAATATSAAPAGSEDPPDAAPGDAKVGADPAPSSGVTADGKVILNVASAEELTRLPGIGKKRAERILALRERLKRFRRVTDLLRVRGIGPRGLKRIAPHVVLDPPAPPAPAPAPGAASQAGSEIR